MSSLVAQPIPAIDTRRIANQLLDAALAYAESGYNVLPLYGIVDGHCECGKTDCHAGKHPRTANGLHDATTDEDTIREWWRQWPNSNIGLAVPHWAVVLDIDPRNGGQYRALGDVPPTVVAATGGGGWHIWFQIPKDCTLRGSTDIPGVDVRKPGSYVVAPPSLHTSGTRYRWSQGTLESRKPMGLPDHLLALLKQPERAEKAPCRSQASYAPGNPSKWLEWALERAQPGNRNATGFALCCQLRDDGISVEEAGVIVQEYAAQVADRGDHPYTQGEAFISLRQAYSSEARPPAVAQGDTSSTPTCGTTVQAFGTPAPSLALSLALSQKTEFKRAEAPPFEGVREDWLARAREADAMPADGIPQHPGSPAQLRRRAQYAVIRDVWPHLFGLPLLSLAECSTALNLVEPGMEAEMVVDFMLTLADVPRDASTAVKAPRAHFLASLRNAVRRD